MALANKVKHVAGDLVKLETTPRHRSASNPAERAIQAVEEVRTIRADDAGFLGKVKSLPWDAQDGIVRGRPRKEPAPPPPVVVGENTRKHNPGLPDKTEDTHSETPKADRRHE